MALKLGSNDTIKVVAFQDDCVNCSRETYNTYLQNLDENLLELNGEPTRFVLKKILPYNVQSQIESDRIKVDSKTQLMTVSMSSLHEIRVSLIAIESPSDQKAEDRIEFKKDSDNYASKDLMAALNSVGIVTDLYTAKQAAASSVSHLQKK